MTKLRLVELAERPERSRESVSGEGSTYLGRTFRLGVHAVRDHALSRLDRGWLEVCVPRGLGELARRRAARAAVIEWYRDRAASRLPARLERFTRKLGVPMPRVMLRDQARRWGSCNEKGEVSLNWRIVQAPMVLVDYVVAHEAVHLKHRNHTRAYWAELARLVPDVDWGRRRAAAPWGKYSW